MSLCTCGHTQEEHLSSDGLDHSCQADECACSNYVTPTEEQKESFAELGWLGSTNGQDTSTQETSQKRQHATEELEDEDARVNEHKAENDNVAPPHLLFVD
jgi:hypothetical protein